MSSQVILELESVSKRFGGLAAVSDVSFSLETKKVTALIGPNGAGKSTLINLVTGVVRSDNGRMVLAGKDITTASMHERASLGISRSYQTPQMIAGLSAFANVMAGAHRFGSLGLLRTIVQPWKAFAENADLSDRAAKALRRLRVAEDWWQKDASGLPYGIQRRVEIARALAQEPLVMLLDEPAAGLNPVETMEIADIILDLAAEGRAILLVEHDMPMVMKIASNIVVVNFGRRIAGGSPSEVASNPDVITAYLGADEELEGVEA